MVDCTSVFSTPGWSTFLLGGTTALTSGNRAGFYQTGERVSVALERPLLMQTDGDVAWEAKEFHFKVLPGSFENHFLNHEP